MTSDELRATIARLRALLDKASLGPWELAGDSPAHIVVVDDETGSIAGHITEAGRDDAELIAALRNAAPVLLDAAERALALEKDNAELRHDIARHVSAVAAERNAALEEAALLADNALQANLAAAIRTLKEPT